jgi:SAM-dependent methyltransferase
VEQVRRISEQINPGARWVERFLIPILESRGLIKDGNAMRCLQIDPDDDTEVLRLGLDGHNCDVLVTTPNAVDAKERGIHAADPCDLPFSSSRYDLVWTGFVGRILARTQRDKFVRELRRICRPNGAFLTAIGNRWCPLDLTKNARLLHGPGEMTLLSLSEAERLFVNGGGFAGVHPLCVSGHFGWSRVSKVARPIVWALEANWRWLATPSNRFFYSSPLNPVLMLWIQC